MGKRTLLVLIVLHFLAALVILFVGVIPAHAEDECAIWDTFIGGERFDYVVDAEGNWNLPDDAQIFSTMTFPKTGIWKYYSESQDTSYVIVFLNFEPTQPPGSRLGQHNICVEKLHGLGMGDE